MKLKFTRKRNDNTHQVRFWSDAAAYKEFKAEAKKNGLFYGDVFKVLMEYFIEQSKNKQLAISGAKE